MVRRESEAEAGKRYERWGKQKTSTNQDEVDPLDEIKRAPEGGKLGQSFFKIKTAGFDISRRERSVLHYTHSQIPLGDRPR